MADMEIRSTGEVLLDGFQVAAVTFGTPTAHYDLCGVWGGEDECHCCVDEEEWDELIAERDGYADKLATVREKLAAVERELARRGGGGVRT